MEILLIELLNERPPQPIKIRHAEIVGLTECREAVLISDRAKLLVEVAQSLRRSIADPLGVMGTEVVFALAIDDMPDNDECHFGNRALTTENGEIEVDPRAVQRVLAHTLAT